MAPPILSLVFALGLLPRSVMPQRSGLVLDPKAVDNAARATQSLPIDLSALFDNQAFGMKAGEANFDGIHYGYPAQYVPPEHLTLSGVDFIFPQYKAGGKDNLVAQGQTLNPPKGRYSAIHMLTAAEHTAIATGFVNATYEGANDTTSDPVLVQPYWDWPYPFASEVVFPYLLTNTSIDYNRTGIYHTTNWLDSSKELSSIKLPNITAGAASGPGGAAENTRLHIFAVSLVPASVSGLSIQYARSTQTWFEGTNKTQIMEATINNGCSDWIFTNQSVRVTVSAPGLDTITPGVINRLRPGDQAVVQVGVVNKDGVEPGTTGEATLHIEGTGISTTHQFNATYGIADYEATFESIYSHESPPWYNDAKYGIFTHWGIYSVPAYGNEGKNESYSEWYWWDVSSQGPGQPGQFYEYNLKTYGPNHSYDEFIPQFTAENYDPKEWVDLFADAGANYFVFVSKHHDGMALFDLPENVTERTTVKLGPKRNLLQELFDAAKQHQPQLHRATYFSLPEWFSPAYLPYGFGSWPGGNATNPYTNVTLPYTGYVEVGDYVTDVILPEMQTLADMGTEIMWCDIGGPNRSAEFAAEYFNSAANEGRQVLLNSRCGLPGDFDTPEYARYDALPSRKWESNLGMDPYSYGFNHLTPLEEYMKPDEIVTSLVDIVSKNGNFLLDVGPRADGTIIDIEQDNLRAAGKWIKSHGEAIYGTRYYFITAQEGEAIRFTQTSDAFYILALYPPNGTLVLDSPLPYVTGDQITVVGGNMSGTVVPSLMADNGSLVITVDDHVKNADQYCWVFKISYNGTVANGNASGGPQTSVGNEHASSLGLLLLSLGFATLRTLT